MRQSIYQIFQGKENLSEKKIYIWGSGSGYSRWKEKIDFHAEAIIDSNRNLWGSIVDGIPIVPPDFLKQVDRDNTIIFILSYFYEEIRQQVFSLSFDEINIYCFKDLERTIFVQEKRERQEFFGRRNNLSLQDYIKNLEEEIKSITYREIELLPVVIPYFALLTNYLFLKESNSNLFPTPQKKEYVITGDGPVLVSYVWQKRLRPDLHELINKSISEIPKGIITKIEPKGFEEGSESTISFNHTSIKLSAKWIITTLEERFSNKKYALLPSEVEWLLDFIQYFINTIDFAYSFLSKGNYQVYVSGFANNSEENIHVQVCKKLGIKTYGLQHGTFGKEYEFNEVPFSHVYKYPTVDELLVWGNYPENIVNSIKVDNSLSVVVGNPRYNLTTNERKQIMNSKKTFLSKRTFLVCFIGPGEREFSINQDLLTFADRLAILLGIKYIVKMHPQNKVQKKEFSINKNNCIEFIIDNRAMSSLYTNVDFILSTSSTIIQEAVYHYIPIFVYNSHPAVRSICGELSSIFSKYDELEKMCIELKESKKYYELIEEYNTLGDQFFYNDVNKRPTTFYKEKMLSTIKPKKERVSLDYITRF